MGPSAESQEAAILEFWFGKDKLGSEKKGDSVPAWVPYAITFLSNTWYLTGAERKAEKP